MKLSKFLALSCATLSFAATAVSAADVYPTKPIRWVVAYSAGGGSDALARAVGAQLSKQLGQSVLIDNKPGGATVIGADAVAKSPGDGYTILTADNGTLIFNTALFKKLPYDPNKDFAPIGLMAKFPLVLAVNPNAGYGSAKDLIEAMRKQPGKLSYATPGVGSPHHLAMEMLKERAKIDVVHVAYKGAAPAIQDVVGGQLPLMVVDTAAGMQMMKLASSSLWRRSPRPVFRQCRRCQLIELGYTDIEAAAWQGLVVPSSTPKDVIAKLSSELQKAIASPAIKTQFATMGLEPTPSDAAVMAKHWSDESKYWPKLIRDRQISLD